MNEDQVNVHDVVPSVSIEALLRRRTAFVARLDTLYSTLDELDDLGDASHAGRHQDWLTSDTARYGILDKSDVIKRYDRSVWKYLFNESGLLTFMDAKARRELQENIHSGEVPELTLANIRSTFSVMYDSRDAMFRRGIVNIYRQLSWHYKTNQPVAFRKRLILEFMLSFSFGMYHWAYGRRDDALDDLDRVLHILDGKPEPDHRNSLTAQFRSSIHHTKERGNTLETEYVHARWFKKGTVHITFKRLDLVDKMNVLLAEEFPDALAQPNAA